MFSNLNLKIYSSLLLSSVVLFASACRPATNTALPTMENAMSGVYTNSNEGEYIVKRRGLSYLEGESAFTNKFNVTIVKKLPSVLLDVIKLNEGASLEDLKNDPVIEYVEPNYVRKMNFQPVEAKSPQASAASVRISNITQANNLYKGRPFTTIAVVSTGVDLNHPDLKSKLVTGFSAFSEEDSPQDINGIGTHQAGVIVASNPSAGVFGVAPDCKVMPIKAMNEDGEVRDADLIRGVVWAVDHGASVVTFTAEGKSQSKAIDDMVKYAFNKRVPIVVGSGDSGANSQSYPAATKGVISVSALDESSRVVSTSSTGSWVSVSAPGQNIMSTSSTKDSKLGSNYASVSGSAIAAAYAAGEMALIKSKYPTLDMVGLRNHLELTTDDLGSKGPDDNFGFGRINAAKALTTIPPKK